MQSQSQLKAIYKDTADIVSDSCDTFLFLGGEGTSTIKELAELLGRETIDMYNTSVMKGTQESHGQNYQKLGKELLSQDEIAFMDGGKCIFQLRGARLFFSSKLEAHGQVPGIRPKALLFTHLFGLRCFFASNDRVCQHLGFAGVKLGRTRRFIDIMPLCLLPNTQEF